MNFVTVFTQLCNEKGKAPTAVCMELGLSDAIYTYWKKNNTVPRLAVLQKISDYFGVTIDYLKGETENRTVPDEALSGIDFALSGEIKQLTNNEKQDILDYIRFKKQQRGGNK